MVPQARGKVHRLGKFGNFDVPDPYRQGRPAFEQALRLIERNLDDLLKLVRDEEYLPGPERERLGLPDLPEALHSLHRPGSVAEAERGGQVTYHGPGQLVAYTLIDLRRAGLNVRQLVSALEQVFLIEQIAPNHGRIRLAGMALCDLLGMDPRGMPITTHDEGLGEGAAGQGPSRLLHQHPQCLLGPELDVPVVPQGSEVRVHLSADRQRQVLPVAVIRRGNDCYPPPAPAARTGWPRTCAAWVASSKP